MFASPLRRRASAAALVLVGSSLAFFVVAADHAPSLGPVLALAGVLTAALGALDLVGSFDPEPEDEGRAIPWSRLRAPLALLVTTLLAFVLALRAATLGGLGIGLAAVVVPAAFLALMASLHRLASALGAAERLSCSAGARVIVGATLLYLPLLGATALIDPWESHYGEVAREMIARDDWISPWWAQGRWFWSKPVLDLWLEALSMRTLGVHAGAGAMLLPIAGHAPRPEWALRLPSFLFAVVGLYAVHRGVARSFGRRTGLVAALVLATMPQFFLMARQATTDMPLVGSLAAALGLLLVAMTSTSREGAPCAAVRVRGRVVHLNVAQLVLAGAVVLILPQVLYLLSRNVTVHLTAWPTFELHADRFASGSPGNCELPGNAACAPETPLHPGFPPALQALGWLFALVVVVVDNRGERRLERVAYLGAFLFGAVAMMAKGPLGVVLPGCAFLAMLLVTGRLARLQRAPIATGTLLVVAATLPWYVAEFSRHGAPFTDELIFQNMIGRATSHLHDTNAGDDTSFSYYLWQLGYAVFGWAGLTPVALAYWPAVRAGATAAAGRRRRSARALALLWVVLTFALFTAMPTKFHHYIFPALPALAVLIALLVDDLLEAPRTARGGALAGAMLGGAALVLLVARDLAAKGVAGEARLLNLVTYNYGRAWPQTVVVGPVLGVAGLAFALLLAGLAFERLRRVALVGLAVASVAFAAWGLDGYLWRAAPHWGQRDLIEAYLRARTSEADPIAAFNMNWKGENFYTGNHVAVFPQGGKIQTWMTARRAAGARSFFFLTEHARVPGLQAEVGHDLRVVTLTTKADNNKFALVQVGPEPSAP